MDFFFSFFFWGGGAFLYIIGCFKVKIQNGNIFCGRKFSNIFGLSTHYPLSAIQVCSKLLAVRVFEISSFLCSNLQRFFLKFSPGNLLISSIS